MLDKYIYIYTYKLSEAWQPVRKSQMDGVFFHPTKGQIPDFWLALLPLVFPGFFRRSKVK